MPITHLPRIDLANALLDRHPLSLVVQPPQQEIHGSISHGRQDNRRNRHRMPNHIPTITLAQAIDLARHNPRTIPNRLLQTNRRRTLKVPRITVDDPSHVQADAAVDTRGRDEGGKIQHGRLVHGYTEHHCVPNGSDECEGCHEESATVEVVRCEGDADVYR